MGKGLSVIPLLKNLKLKSSKDHLKFFPQFWASSSPIEEEGIIYSPGAGFPAISVGAPVFSSPRRMETGLYGHRRVNAVTVPDAYPPTKKEHWGQHLLKKTRERVYQGQGDKRPSNWPNTFNRATDIPGGKVGLARYDPKRPKSPPSWSTLPLLLGRPSAFRGMGGSTGDSVPTRGRTVPLTPATWASYNWAASGEAAFKNLRNFPSQVPSHRSHFAKPFALQTDASDTALWGCTYKSGGSFGGLGAPPTPPKPQCAEHISPPPRTLPPHSLGGPGESQHCVPEPRQKRVLRGNFVLTKFTSPPRRP
ncbi:hypothetical protein GWK47_029973 [Chionoecetes opilio]|uniref:Uncharacterized protein n=1 Tax=Chionoecetes opilio TaxID=41210 RepID=A0A8J4YMN5_CHIOP|nr:hypothetical protein GWK47_029973 [Chionoecetes opilio]